MALRLDRYVFRQFLIALVVVSGTLVGLYLGIDFITNLKKFLIVAPGELASFCALYYGERLPGILVALGPAITLVAAAASLARLTRANEILAMLAAGRSVHRVLVPIFFGAFGVAGVMAALQEVVIPATALDLLDSEARLESNEVQSNLLLSDRYNDSIFMTRYFPKAREMTVVSITRLDEEGRLQCDLYAERVRWDEARGGWTCFRGKLFKYQADGVHRDGPPIRFGDEGLFWDLTLRPEDIQKYTVPVTYRSFGELLEICRGDPGRDDARTTLHSRISIPIGNLVLLGMGLPFLLRREVRGLLLGIGICVLVSVIFFGAQFACLQLGTAGVIHPILAAWFPVVLFGSAAVMLMDGIPT